MTVEVSPSGYHFRFGWKEEIRFQKEETVEQQTRVCEIRTVANYLMARTVLINDLAILDF